jgi:molybdopterin/thiamine biosynthesis adenylyltransferase
MYSRFTALSDYSEQDQKRLENSTAAVIGLGATGSAIAENLARHGVNLIIFDRDYLEVKDAYSSSLYTPKQCEKALPKAEAAREKLERFTDVEAFSESFSSDSLRKISSADIIMDGADNIETRQMINDYSKKEGVPWIYTAAIAEKAYSMFLEERCFNCISDKTGKVATCETDGIMREVAQKAAAASSKKAVEFLAGKDVGEELELVHEGRKLAVEGSGCEVCSRENFPHLGSSNDAVQVCGAGKFQLERDFSREEVEDFPGEIIAENDFLIRMEYEGRELTFFDSGRAIVEARDKDHAEAILGELGI